jgi:integrase
MRRHKGRQQAYVFVQGRDIYLGPWKGRQPSQQAQDAYNRFLHEWAANHGQLPVESNDLTMAELYARFIAHCDRTYLKDGKPTGEADSHRAAWRFAIRLYADLPIRQFSPLKLKAVRQLMIEADLARVYINGLCGRIRHAFRWAAGNELVPETVWLALKSVEALKVGRGEARETDKKRPVADELVEATILHLPETVAAIVRLQRATGMRPAEAVAIAPELIDRSADVWVYTPRTHKNAHRGKSRSVALGPKSQEILAPFMDRDAGEYCFPPLRERKPDARPRRSRANPKKTPRRPGAHYTVAAYRRAVAKAVLLAFPCPALEKIEALVAERRAQQMDAGKKRPDGRKIRREIEAEHPDLVQQYHAWRERYAWHPNRLRHSRATEVRAAYGVEASQSILGHARTAVVDVYAEKSLALAVKVARETG